MTMMGFNIGMFNLILHQQLPGHGVQVSSQADAGAFRAVFVPADRITAGGLHAVQALGQADVGGLHAVLVPADRISAGGLHADLVPVEIARLTGPVLSLATGGAAFLSSLAATAVAASFGLPGSSAGWVPAEVARGGALSAAYAPAEDVTGPALRSNVVENARAGPVTVGGGIRVTIDGGLPGLSGGARAIVRGGTPTIRARQQALN